MKTIKKSCTVYQAFDGSEFTNRDECMDYEYEKAKAVKVNLKNFEIYFPMQDSFTNCRAYLVRSENEFNMLTVYIQNEYPDFDDGYADYEGDGWYVVQCAESGYADLYKLSTIIKDWNDTLNLIVDNTVDL